MGFWSLVSAHVGQNSELHVCLSAHAGQICELHLSTHGCLLTCTWTLRYTCIAYYKSVVHHTRHLASEASLVVITIMVVQEPLCCRLLHANMYMFQINVSALLTYMTTLIVIIPCVHVQGIKWLDCNSVPCCCAVSTKITIHASWDLSIWATCLSTSPTIDHDIVLSACAR